LNPQTLAAGDTVLVDGHAVTVLMRVDHPA
jgi:hypothetical protein